jgi:hypothetical protein
MEPVGQVQVQVGRIEDRQTRATELTRVRTHKMDRGRAVRVRLGRGGSLHDPGPTNLDRSRALEA